MDEAVHSMIINLPRDPQAYALLRGALSIAGDTSSILRLIRKLAPLHELQGPIENLCDELQRFRGIRNLFAHLDERLTELDKWGLSGSMTLDCGIEYGPRSRGNFHLIVSDDHLHFPHRPPNATPPIADKVRIGRRGFEPIFAAARAVYNVLTSHKTHAQTYPASTEIYPD